MSSLTNGTFKPRRYLPGPVPRLLAHRGLSTAPGRRCVENTCEAFQQAIDAGATVIETDTRASSDGVALTFHDASTGRLATQDLLVERTRYRTLAQLRLGREAPTRLIDALTAFPHTQFNIDVKSHHAVFPTVAAIAKAHAFDRVCLTSFDDAIAMRVREHARRLGGKEPLMSASRTTVALFMAAVTLGAPQPLVTRLLESVSALQIPLHVGGISLVTPRTIAAAHRAGCEIHVWTIDSPQQMRTLLEEGVDGIVTNRVDVLARVVHEGHPRSR